jgi:hypothetical protein
MKTKATKKSVNFILLLSGLLFAQLANAECPAGKVYACRVDACGFSDCKCVSQSQLQNWMAIIPPCGGGNNHCCRGFRTSSNGSTITETLLQAYPNPVTNFATISLSLSRSQRISLKIFDMNGRLIDIVAEGSLDEGEYTFTWNASQVSEGVYLLQFQSEEFLQNESLIVTK